MTRMGEWEIRSESRRLPVNLGKLAKMSPDVCGSLFL